jgi:hypothetical protein
MLMPTALVFSQTTKQPAKQTSKPAVTGKSTATLIMPDTLKVPTFTVRFGPFNGTLATLNDELKKVLNSDLIVKDQRGQQWTTVAWRFIWNKTEESDDIKTGKKKFISTYNIVELDSTSKLPASWQNEMKAYLKKGEELIFEKIIVEHPASKRKMFAPDLKLKML